MNTSHDELRWLLRPLGEPAFVHLYREDTALSFRAFEDAFWSLEPDSEHPKETRPSAWRRIEAWKLAGETPALPAHWFVALVRRLRQLLADEPDDGKAELVRFWSVPELFAAPHTPGRIDTLPYHEIHCHLRGAVPFTTLWSGWVKDERWRAALRRYNCEAGRHRLTWAELIAEVAAGRDDLCGATPQAQRADERHFLSWWAEQLVRGCRSDTHAVRYLAVCTGVRRFLLHQRRVTGLSEFHKSYKRYTQVQRRGTRDHDMELTRAILEEFEKHGAVAVELRPTLDRRRSDLQRKLRAIVQGYFDYLGARSMCRPPLVMALVPSLYKQEGLSDDGRDTSSATWRAQAELWCEEVRALLSILEEVPALRYFVVGLDAAGRERGCPPRALAPAFQLVRDYNAAHGLRFARPGRDMAACPPALDWDGLCAAPVPAVRLGVTVHAGEDFEDPLTGLRHIWEALVHLDLGEGDRIGHALAASLEPKLLCRVLDRRGRKRAGSRVEKLDDDRYRVLKPRGEHLLDLAWRYELADGAPVGGTDGPRRALGHELAHFAVGAFGMPVDAQRLADGLNARGADVAPSLPAVRFTDIDHVAPEDCCLVVLDRAWREGFERLRQRTVRELVRRGVVVESCPTSNHAVANLDGNDSPLHVFASVDGLRCAIGTDDPGLFGSWPTDELRRIEETRVRECLLQQNERASFVRLR